MHFRVLPTDDSAANGERTAGETLNISASGVCLAAPAVLVPDTHLALEIKLTERDDAVVAVGRVVWCDPDGDRYRVGICFTWLREDDRADLGRIAKFVEDRLAENE